MEIAPILIAAAAFLAPAQAQPPKAAEAGACARCHINDTVEWAVSRHKQAGVACAGCHGPSQGHVTEERNHVKPDRIPRGAAIASLCHECHNQGCPRTKRQDACQTCHHVHALVDVTGKPPEIVAGRVEKARELAKDYGEAMRAGETLVSQAHWKEALARFEKAGQVRPGDMRASLRASLCRRRLDPPTRGFRVVGDRFDPATGLPAEVEVAEFGLRMLAVSGGAFDIGNEAYADSRPVHTVRIEPFYLGKYEVTQEQWQKVMGSNPSRHREGFADTRRMPVENVSWKDCQEFIGQLNRQVPGGGFRLPTEAEWEFAARFGSPAAARLDAVAWYRENSTIRERPRPDFTDMAPRPAGSKAPNALGFYDMQGNVWEWCSTLWRPYPYRAGDGREDARDPGLRVLRGGSYADGEDLLRPALRHADRADRRFRWNGLRLARDVPEAR